MGELEILLIQTVSLSIGFIEKQVECVTPETDTA
jgi:hypothetical protein